MSFFDRIFNGLAWIKIFLSPALAGLITGLCIWFCSETNLLKIVAVSISVGGIIGGIYLAERIRKKIGTQEFLSGGDGTDETDEKKEDK